MNRPRRPAFSPARKKPSGPPRTDAGTGPPRRRSPLDAMPPTSEPKFTVLGTGVDRQTLMANAQPMEMAVIHGFTLEIEQAFQKFHGRPDDFWSRNQGLIETARKLDEILAGIMTRKPS